jgi:FtsP/CotA-like multicopper oxidase with cupredoxin domain
MTDPDLFTTDTAGLTQVSSPRVVRLADDDRLHLGINPVCKNIEGAELRMLAYNGSIPGPALLVKQGAQITVQTSNDGDVETTVHWHGLRLESAIPRRHPGLWMAHCHIAEHAESGMMFSFNVARNPEPAR